MLSASRRKASRVIENQPTSNSRRTQQTRQHICRTNMVSLNSHHICICIKLTPNPQPAKRRAAEPAEASTGPQRPSKLAKEHNITAAEELEIREAFELFQESVEGEKEKVIPIGDVKRAMKYVARVTPLYPASSIKTTRFFFFV